jgi:hypothetical protein
MIQAILLMQLMMLAMMHVIMLVETMMHVIVLVQTMLQVTGDGGVCDITSPFSNESHKE